MAGVYGTAVAHSASPAGTPWWGWWGDGMVFAGILALLGAYVILPADFPKRLPLPPTYATPRVRIRGWEVVLHLTGNAVVTVRCDVDNYGHVDVPNVSLNFLGGPRTPGNRRSTDPPRRVAASIRSGCQCSVMNR